MTPQWNPTHRKVRDEWGTRQLGTSAVNVYDAANLRVKKTTGATTVVYLFAGTKVIAEYTPSAQTNAPTKEYVYLGAQLLATLDAAHNPTYRQADHLSVRLYTDASGNPLGTQGHLPFGEAWYSTGTVDEWKFTTYEHDGDTGLDYAINRFDSTRLGRFMTPDPYDGSADASNPQSWNRYPYVLNDPVDLVDPSGLHWECRGPANDRTCDWEDDPECDVFSNCRPGPRYGPYVPLWDLDEMYELTLKPRKAANKGLPKCSSLGAVGILAAGISKASQWTGTGYTLGLNGNALKAVGLGVDLSASVALVSDPSGNVGIAKSLAVTPSAGARSYGGGIIIGGSTYSSLSGYSSYSQVNFTTTFGAGLATGFTETSNSSGISTTAYLGFGTGVSAGGSGLSVTNDVQAFCKQ